MLGTLISLVLVVALSVSSTGLLDFRFQGRTKSSELREGYKNPTGIRPKIPELMSSINQVSTKRTLAHEEPNTPDIQRLFFIKKGPVFRHIRRKFCGWLEKFKVVPPSCEVIVRPLPIEPSKKPPVTQETIWPSKAPTRRQTRKTTRRSKSSPVTTPIPTTEEMTTESKPVSTKPTSQDQPASTLSTKPSQTVTKEVSEISTVTPASKSTTATNAITLPAESKPVSTKPTIQDQPASTLSTKASQFTTKEVSKSSTVTPTSGSTTATDAITLPAESKPVSTKTTIQDQPASTLSTKASQIATKEVSETVMPSSGGTTATVAITSPENSLTSFQHTPKTTIESFTTLSETNNVTPSTPNPLSPESVGNITSSERVTLPSRTTNTVTESAVHENLGSTEEGSRGSTVGSETSFPTHKSSPDTTTLIPTTHSLGSMMSSPGRTSETSKATSFMSSQSISPQGATVTSSGMTSSASIGFSLPPDSTRSTPFSPAGTSALPGNAGTTPDQGATSLPRENTTSIPTSSWVSERTSAILDRSTALLPQTTVPNPESDRSTLEHLPSSLEAASTILQLLSSTAEATTTSLEKARLTSEGLPTSFAGSLPTSGMPSFASEEANTVASSSLGLELAETSTPFTETGSEVPTDISSISHGYSRSSETFGTYVGSTISSTAPEGSIATTEPDFLPDDPATVDTPDSFARRRIRRDIHLPAYRLYNQQYLMDVFENLTKSYLENYEHLKEYQYALDKFQKSLVNSNFAETEREKAEAHRIVTEIRNNLYSFDKTMVDLLDYNIKAFAVEGSQPAKASRSEYLQLL